MFEKLSPLDSSREDDQGQAFFSAEKSGPRFLVGSPARKKAFWRNSSAA
ncbi:MAG TPA: hypothetical protein HA252_06195 [Candidatus Diapherotrites archaeon]|uniref:Uncharacterized protein n=1 Tax=Candidatus Iainarchaeum sp. TaxID=3101447 RepID=A0A7J4JH03_9ARCH|nr:hypothetical protein [Candidatus Diapherotrites archaeon]